MPRLRVSGLRCNEMATRYFVLLDVSVLQKKDTPKHKVRLRLCTEQLLVCTNNCSVQLSQLRLIMNLVVSHVMLTLRW